MPELTLYTTLGCHLCEDAKAVCWAVLPHFSFRLTELDIADEDGLIERYGVRIPVLQLAGRVDDLGWPFSEQQLLDYLSGEAIK